MVKVSNDVFSPAVAHWWNSKRDNNDDVRRSQGGTRDSNLRGDTMDGFRDVIISELKGIGVSEDDIFAGNQLSKYAANLPSYYRASKNWDIIIVKNSRFKNFERGLVSDETDEQPTLIAAIEFKSQHGSIGNNQNNRIEESIGNAVDFWNSFENRNFVHVQPRPWLGYLFVGRYKSGDLDVPVEMNHPHFTSDLVFALGTPPNDRSKYPGASYANRYCIFLERMILKKLYDSACFITTHETMRNEKANHFYCNENLTGERFMDSLLRYVRAYY